MTSSRCPPRGRRIAAVLIGFTGVVLVIKPSTQLDGLDWEVAFALLCAASLAARDLVTRMIPAEVPSVLIALVTTMAVCIAGVALRVRDSAQQPQHRRASHRSCHFRCLFGSNRKAGVGSVHRVLLGGL